MSHSKDLPALSEMQWEIMNVIWDRGACSVAEAWKTLSERRCVARNTVQTQMARLEEKGWLARTEAGNGLLYAPTVSRQQSQQLSVQRLIETVFDGSPAGLVLALLHGGKLSKGEADRIRQLITDSQGRKR